MHNLCCSALFGLVWFGNEMKLKEIKGNVWFGKERKERFGLIRKGWIGLVWFGLVWFGKERKERERKGRRKGWFGWFGFLERKGKERKGKVRLVWLVWFGLVWFGWKWKERLGFRFGLERKGKERLDSVLKGRLVLKGKEKSLCEYRPRAVREGDVCWLSLFGLLMSKGLLP